MVKDIVVVSGGFDPLHSGHISYINEAKRLGEYLIVALNSDNWLTRKKGKYFLGFEERSIIIKNLKSVNEVIEFDDSDGSCVDALEKIKKTHVGSRIIFCNGGDRNKSNIPEMNVKGVHFKFGVGGDFKMNSSSWILERFYQVKEDRIWGEYTNLFQDAGIKVKELVVEPKKGMSFQRHFHRNEIWFVSKGKCQVNLKNKKEDEMTTIALAKHDFYNINVNQWHQIFNPYKEPCHIIEIQFGDKTEENDIERLFYYDEKKD